MEFPAGQSAVHLLIENMADYLHTLQHNLFLLIDDCHLMQDSRVFDLLFALCDIPTNKRHMIVVSRSGVFMRGLCLRHQRGSAGDPGLASGGKLEEVNLLSPGRPMFEIIYNQVLLLQKKYAAVLGRGEALLGACRIFPHLLCKIHLHIETDGTWLLYTAESAGEELYFYGISQMLGDGSLCMMTSEGITVATADLSGDDLDMELTEEYKWLFEDYGTTSMWFRREASSQPLEGLGGA